MNEPIEAQFRHSGPWKPAELVDADDGALVVVLAGEHERLRPGVEAAPAVDGIGFRLTALFFADFNSYPGKKPGRVTRRVTLGEDGWCRVQGYVFRRNCHDLENHTS